MSTSHIAYEVIRTKTALIYYWDSLDSIFYRIAIPREEFLCIYMSAFQIGREGQSGMVLLKGSPFKEIFNEKYAESRPVCLKSNRINLWFDL